MGPVLGGRRDTSGSSYHLAARRCVVLARCGMKDATQANPQAKAQEPHVNARLHTLIVLQLCTLLFIVHWP